MAGTLSRYAVEAAELEAAAASSGSDAPQLLVEAAHQWRLAGDSERSQGLLGTVIAGGGEMGCYARAELAGLLFDAGAHDAAFAELALLADDPECGDGPSRVVAELLTDQGALTAAVPWYDRVVTTGDPILEVNRSRVRKRLGLSDPE